MHFTTLASHVHTFTITIVIELVSGVLAVGSSNFYHVKLVRELNICQLMSEEFLGYFWPISYGVPINKMPARGILEKKLLKTRHQFNFSAGNLQALKLTLYAH